MSQSRLLGLLMIFIVVIIALTTDAIRLRPKIKTSLRPQPPSTAAPSPPAYSTAAAKEKAKVRSVPFLNR